MQDAKLVEGVTGRSNVVAFTNGFHAASLSALAAAANSSKRRGSEIPLPRSQRTSDLPVLRPKIPSSLRYKKVCTNNGVTPEK
jgi:4-aminobutyrate aminotransferase-like enzyme